jgi:hypothetical protein
MNKANISLLTLLSIILCGGIISSMQAQRQWGEPQIVNNISDIRVRFKFRYSDGPIGRCYDNERIVRPGETWGTL